MEEVISEAKMTSVVRGEKKLEKQVEGFFHPSAAQYFDIITHQRIL